MKKQQKIQAGLLNIRLEKKPDKYIGPKVVSIDTKLVQIKAKNFLKEVNSGDVTNAIIIFMHTNKKGEVYTTWSNERTAYELRRVTRLYEDI